MALLVTHEQLEAMSPSERAEFIRNSRVHLKDLSPESLERIRVAGEKLLAESAS